MAWTATDLTAIETAIASGVQRVSYTDKTVVYQTIADMLKARDVIKAEVDAVASGGRSAVKRYSFAGFDRGA